MVPQLLSGRSLILDLDRLLWLSEAPICSVPLLELSQRRLLAARHTLPHFKLFLDALEPRVLLADRFEFVLASISHLLHGWEPALLRRQASDWMRYPRNDLLRIPCEYSRDRGDVDLRIICVTRAIAAEEELRPLGRVGRDLVLAARRSRQAVGRDRQRLE